MAISLKLDGDFSKTSAYLKRLLKLFKTGAIDKYGKRGVEALRSATPMDTGLTAECWYYETTTYANGFEITWMNTNIHNGFNVAVGLQYGHGTGTGGYVSGRDFINPAIQPVFEEMADELWREVCSL